MTEPKAVFTNPQLLSIHHDVSSFSSGEPILDDWLRTRGLDNIAAGASRTYVVCPASSLVVAGYYALSMGSIGSDEVIGGMRRNMPKEIPAIILGRLAVGRAWQGAGLGGKLLWDAVDRCSRAAEQIAARLVVVHAISPEAEAFYRHNGFQRLPAGTATLALDLVKFAKGRALSPGR